MQKMKGLAKKELGATMVEYAIMVALIAVVSIAVIATLGEKVNNTFSNVSTQMGNVAP
jgi:pilus assembly protein Flp/PilA